MKTSRKMTHKAAQPMHRSGSGPNPAIPIDISQPAAGKIIHIDGLAFHSQPFSSANSDLKIGK
jgi:hypothetical protein